MQTSFDFEPVFFGNVLLPIYDYTAHGDGSEFTLRRNRQAFDWVDIVPSRAAVPASQVDLSSELLGVKMKFPIIVAPTAAMVPLHPDGEIGMFKAATAASNTLMILSINTSTPYAKVAPAAPGGTLWGQFYPLENLATTQRSMDTYQNAGCQRHHRHRRSAGVLLRTHAAGPQFRRARCWRRRSWRAAPEAALQRPPVRHGTGSTASASGTPGSISTMCGK